MKCYHLLTISLCSVLMHRFLCFRCLPSNLIGKELFRRNYFRASYLFVYYENDTRCTVIKKKRLEIYWSTLNAHCACWKTTLYLSPAIAAKGESLVTDIVMDVLIRFPVIAQRLKGACYFHSCWSSGN